MAVEPRRTAPSNANPIRSVSLEHFIITSPFIRRKGSCFRRMILLSEHIRRLKHEQRANLSSIQLIISRTPNSIHFKQLDVIRSPGCLGSPFVFGQNRSHRCQAGGPVKPHPEPIVPVHGQSAPNPHTFRFGAASPRKLDTSQAISKVRHRSSHLRATLIVNVFGCQFLSIECLSNTFRGLFPFISLSILAVLIKPFICRVCFRELEKTGRKQSGQVESEHDPRPSSPIG